MIRTSSRLGLLLACTPQTAHDSYGVRTAGPVFDCVQHQMHGPSAFRRCLAFAFQTQVLSEGNEHTATLLNMGVVSLQPSQAPFKKSSWLTHLGSVNTVLSKRLHLLQQHADAFLPTVPKRKDCSLLDSFRTNPA